VSYFDDLKKSNTEFAIYQEIYDNYIKSISDENNIMLYNTFINSEIGKYEYKQLLRKRKIKRIF
jgi:hypothetical protein